MWKHFLFFLILLSCFPECDLKGGPPFPLMKSSQSEDQTAGKTWTRNGGILSVDLRSSSTAELEKRIFYVGGVDYIYILYLSLSLSGSLSLSLSLSLTPSLSLSSCRILTSSRTLPRCDFDHLTGLCNDAVCNALQTTLATKTAFGLFSWSAWEKQQNTA